MSLLTTASVWVDTPKKRTPTIRKTIKKTAVNNNNNNNNYSSFTTVDNINEYETFENSNDNNINNIDEIEEKEQHPLKKQQENQNINNNKVNLLLEKMNTLNSESDGSGLYDYKPPSTNIKNKESFESSSSLPLTHPIFQPKENNNGLTYSSSNSLKNPNIATYRQAYEKPNPVTFNYTNMGIDESSTFENKIMDRIQYLTHLIEEIQNEKTANITEEFVLYTMLGVFVIYVVDSFTRIGKYTR